MGTDSDWETYGRQNPYFGVLTDPRYRGLSLSDTLLHEFFASGNDDVELTLSSIERHLILCPRLKALDFGCGVGRLAIPLAQRFKSVVGVDVSPSMLQEAKINAQRMGVDNLRLYENLTEVPDERGTFSFVNTFIVLQHIDPRRGQKIIAQLLTLLSSGGCGAIHLTYGYGRFPKNWGRMPLFFRATRALNRPLSALRQKLTRGDPDMQMHAYSINRVLFQLQAEGVTEFFTQFTNHGSHFGVRLLFTKP